MLAVLCPLHCSFRLIDGWSTICFVIQMNMIMSCLGKSSRVSRFIHMTLVLSFSQKQQKLVRLRNSCCSDLLTADLLQRSLSIQRGAVSITQALILCQPSLPPCFLLSAVSAPIIQPLSQFVSFSRAALILFFILLCFNECRLGLLAENALEC